MAEVDKRTGVGALPVTSISDATIRIGTSDPERLNFPT